MLLAGLGAVVIGMLQVKGTAETVVLATIGATVLAVGWCVSRIPQPLLWGEDFEWVVDQTVGRAPLLALWLIAGAALLR